MNITGNSSEVSVRHMQALQKTVCMQTRIKTTEATHTHTHTHTHSISLVAPSLAPQGLSNVLFELYWHDFGIAIT